MESQPQSSTGDTMSTSQRLSSDAQEPNLQSEGNIRDTTPSKSAGKLHLCLK